MARPRSAWWPGGRDGDEGVLPGAVEDAIDGVQRAARGRESGSPRAGRDARVTRRRRSRAPRAIACSIARTYAASWTRSIDARPASGASATSSSVNKPLAASRRSIAAIRSLRSGCPGPVS